MDVAKASLDVAVHAEAPRPGDALAPAPAKAPDAPLSKSVATLVCYQFIVKALMATDSDKERDVADCLVRIHNAWDKDVKNADGLVDDCHCSNFVAASAQTANLRVLLSQVAAAADATLQRMFAPVRQGEPVAPGTFVCPVLAAPRAERAALVVHGLYTVKELFLLIGTLVATALVGLAGTYLVGSPKFRADRSTGAAAAAITKGSKPSFSGRIPAAAALMSCLAPSRS